MGTAATEVRLDLSHKQAMAWDLLEDDPQVTEIMYGGAAGGGKTYFGCAWQIYRRISYPGTRGAIGRSELKRLKLTTLKTFRDVWNGFFIYNHVGVTITENAQTNTIHFSNGSEIVLLDLFQYPSDPDFTALGSLEITDAFIDEAPEITEKAFEILSSRVRYRLDRLPVKQSKILLAGNPANNWVKWRYVRDKDGKPVTLRDYQAFIPALLSDNPDPEFRHIYGQQLGKLNEYDRARLLEGDWDAEPMTGGEFYEAFSRPDHVRRVDFDPELPAVHLSFDQNVLPYNSCLVAQIAGDEIRLIDEICVSPPAGTTEHLCDEFARRYNNAKAVFMYGDASGNKRTTRGNETDYDIIRRKLQRWMVKASDRTNLRNESTAKRRDFTNKVLRGDYNYRLIVDPRCRNMIMDFTRCKVDANGGKLKSTERDPITGATFQPVGHLGDCFEYFLTAVLNREWRQYTEGR